MLTKPGELWHEAYRAYHPACQKLPQQRHNNWVVNSVLFGSATRTRFVTSVVQKPDIVGVHF